MNSNKKELIYNFCLSIATLGLSWAIVQPGISSPLGCIGQLLKDISPGLTSYFLPETLKSWLKKIWLNNSNPTIHNHIGQALMISWQKTLDQVLSDYTKKKGELYGKEAKSLPIFISNLKNISEKEFIKNITKKLDKEEILKYASTDVDQISFFLNQRFSLEEKLDSFKDEPYLTQEFIIFFKETTPVIMSMQFRTSLQAGNEAKHTMDLLYQQTLQEALCLITKNQKEQSEILDKISNRLDSIKGLDSFNFFSLNKSIGNLAKNLYDEMSSLKENQYKTDLKIDSILSMLDEIRNQSNIRIGNVWNPEKTKSTTDLKSFNDLIKILSIKDMKVEYIFRPRLKAEFLKSTVVESNDTFESHIQAIYDLSIRKRKIECEKNGVVFKDDGSFSLHRMDVERFEGKEGAREYTYKLILKKTSYYIFTFSGYYLDTEFINPLNQQSETIRQITGLEKNKLSFKNLQSLEPYHFRIGTGTSIITKDGFIICSIRSKVQAVAQDMQNDWLQVHLSTAEGMFRSTNAPEKEGDLLNGFPSPFATSYSSLNKELGMPQSRIEREKITCLGAFMDLKRAQPYFVFYYKSEYTAQEFFDFYNNVPLDKHENDAIFALKWNKESALNLFNKQRMGDLDVLFPDIDKQFFDLVTNKKIKIASNHAEAGFALSMWTDFFEAD